MGFGLCIRVGVELVVLAHAGGGLVGKKLGGRMGTIPGKSEGVSEDPRFEISKNALFQIITVVTYLKSNKSKKTFVVHHSSHWYRCTPDEPRLYRARTGKHHQGNRESRGQIDNQTHATVRQASAESQDGLFQLPSTSLGPNLARQT